MPGSMKILVTGNAGFIGFHVARALIARGDAVVGIDAVNDYYDPGLKEARLAELERAAAATGSFYEFRRADLADRAAVEGAFADHRFDRVINLAAQAGVRYSLENPLAYVQSNVVGFTHVLEACRQAQVAHLTYASTSSVYGANAAMPFSEGQGVDHPLQFYAATKRANELMAHAYSHLYRLPTTGLRFFTVYGPWGRPDMAPMLFASAILEGRPIKVYGHGAQSRDFTYIDDIVEGVLRASDRVAAPDPDWDPADPDPATSNAPFRIYNIGNNAPVGLADFIAALETALGQAPPSASSCRCSPATCATPTPNSTRLARATNWRPATPIATGVARFVDWYRDYYGTDAGSG